MGMIDFVRNDNVVGLKWDFGFVGCVKYYLCSVL